MSEGQTPAAGRAKARLHLEQELGRQARGQGRPPLRPLPHPDLTHCTGCDSNLVYPIDWEPAGKLGWSITLRCPECERRSSGVFDQEAADRFDDALDASTQAVLDDLLQMTRANMESQIKRFVKALEEDWILPEDF